MALHCIGTSYACIPFSSFAMNEVLRDIEYNISSSTFIHRRRHHWSIALPQAFILYSIRPTTKSRWNNRTYRKGICIVLYFRTEGQWSLPRWDKAHITTELLPTRCWDLTTKWGRCCPRSYQAWPFSRVSVLRRILSICNTWQIFETHEIIVHSPSKSTNRCTSFWKQSTASESKMPWEASGNKCTQRYWEGCERVVPLYIRNTCKQNALVRTKRKWKLVEFL